MIKSLRGFWASAEYRAVGSAFLAMALSFGAWITRLPEIQQALQLSDGQLGTALFFAPLGAVSLLPFYSKLISALSERRATLVGLTILTIGLILTTQANSYPMLMISIYGLGLGIGLTDVSMNAVAAEIEKQRKVQIMSTCHGFFSIGGMLGALFSTGFIALGFSLTIQTAILALALLVFVALQSNKLINAQVQEKVKGLSLPPKEVLGLALIGICVMMSEGAITDWSTIYLKRDLSVVGRWSGLGFAGFSLLMALGRFNGDDLILRFSGVRLIRIGIIIGVIGLLLVQLKLPIPAIIGFSMAGLGFSVVIPIVFGRAAKVKGVSSAKGLAAVASAGYVGWLVGPVTIGYISNWLGLQVAFLFLVGLCMVAFLTSFKVD